MHRPSAGLLAASLVSMMKGVGSVAAAAAKSTEAIDDFNNALLTAAPQNVGPRHYPAQGSHTAFLNQESRRPSPDYIARQRLKARWENGFQVPKHVADALEAAAARRAPILARRAKMYASGMKAVG